MSIRLAIKPVAAALAFLLAACAQGQAENGDTVKPRVGLFTTLPIYWGEGGIENMLEGETEPSWVRTALEKRFELVPLDTLEPEAIEELDRVILAQPRALAPSENVSFDDWVKAGGKALIFADPMLTGHSDYAIGDRRRPQDVVLLSPLFAHWGLELRFDENQPSGERGETYSGKTYPVNLAGTFVKGGERSEADCSLLQNPLLARCVVGVGEALLFADAAVLDWEGKGTVPQARLEALEQLTDSLLD